MGTNTYIEVGTKQALIEIMPGECFSRRTKSTVVHRLEKVLPVKRDMSNLRKSERSEFQGQANELYCQLDLPSILASEELSHSKQSKGGERRFF